MLKTKTIINKKKAITNLNGFQHGPRLLEHVGVFLHTNNDKKIINNMN